MRSKANRLTRECFQTALIKLMNEKPFDRITITELVKKSGVSRQSFYRNYRYKQDVLSDMKTEMKDAVAAYMKVEGPERGSREWYLEFFADIKENREIIQILYTADRQSENGYSFLPSFHDIFSSSSIDETYKIAAYQGGLNAILNSWFQNGMKEDALSIATLCEALFGQIHRELTIKQ